MSVSIEQLKSMNEDEYQLIDMRNESEIAHGEIPGAIAIQADEIENSELVDKSKKLIICCSRGQNSVEVAENLVEKGYDAESLEGGYVAWLLDMMKEKEAEDISKDVEQSLRKKFKKKIWCKFTKAINQYELVKDLLPNVEYDELSHIIKIEKKDKEHIGKIAICTAGTADIAVAEEAAQTAEYFGSHVDRVFDIGVSGIHRLFSRLEVIQDANCVIAVAGMEGALASVLGGLVDKPVIAVPTSVGYGASMNGLSALLTMINSCANGIAVVNIDNGYGAGYIATQINRLASREYNAK